MSTGTVYGLRDPRDGVTRYIGATINPLSARLNGHLGGKAGRRVRAWITELRAAGFKPEIYAITKGVPAGELREAETAEITRILLSGGTLLNENQTARAHGLIYWRDTSARLAAEHAAWQELAAVALAVLGGPMPPASGAAFEIPDAAWAYMSGGSARAYTDYPAEIQGDGYFQWRALDDERKNAKRLLLTSARRAWPEVMCHLGDRIFTERLEEELCSVIDFPHDTRDDASRHLTLIIWYAVAAYPWWHLAERVGLAEDDASFIAWAGRDFATRRALVFLAGLKDGMLAHLSRGYDSPREISGPGHRLATVAAAYSGSPPPEPDNVTMVMKQILRQYADDHMLTQPMMDLLLLLDPGALDSVFGRDIAADLDRDLSLAAGTSGRVLRALVERHPGCDPVVRRAADRSTHALPVTTLPDYDGWEWRGAPSARMISASLVRAGLAVPAQKSPKEYVAEVCALWTPQPVPVQLRESA